jgi:perosamine synthetase
MIPYGRQWVDEDDIQAVVKVLRSDWLTTGPMVEKFEKAVAEFVNAKYGVAVSSGTAALHAAMDSAEIGSGDEVIVPPMTFAATANAVVFQGGTPVFADIDPDTLLLDPNQVEAKITPRTKAIIAVDFAGQPCDYDALRAISDRHGLILVADACHALGAEYKGRKVGTLADLTIFSFHPVKHITTGEGGMVITDNPEFAAKMCRFRNHGISTEHRERAEKGTWYYEMVDLGYNYRITDFQCALGLSQLKKLPYWIELRRKIAKHYEAAFDNINSLKLLSVSSDVKHVYHLYVIRLKLEQLKLDRAAVFSALRNEGIGVNVHYIPVYLHPYYRGLLGTKPGLCPVAEAAYNQIITLPIFSSMDDSDVEDVIRALCKVVDAATIQN